MGLSLIEELEQLLQKRIDTQINFKNSEYDKLKYDLKIVTRYYNEAKNKICRLQDYIKDLEENNKKEKDKFDELQKRYNELKAKHKITREEKFLLNQEYLKLLRKN